MPISKNGKPYFTDEQYNIARYESSALEYARSAGYQMEKKGNWWTLKDHDSFVFAPNGMWFWNSRDMKGGAIEFLTQVEHKTLVEAVLILSGEREAERQQGGSPPYKLQENTEDEKKAFELPPKADNFKRLFAYLCGTRCLDKEIVQELVKAGSIYESARSFTRDGETKTLHNAVFVGFDKEGNARSGFQRGLSTATERPFKRDVVGSEKEYAFCINGTGSIDTVAVFEAAIDAMAHATITTLSGEDWRSCDRIALGGISFKPLALYLSEHPNVKNVVLCVDADEAGKRAADNLKEELVNAGYTPEKGYCCLRQLPTGYKDFNEYLQAYKSRENQADGFFPEVNEEACEK